MVNCNKVLVPEAIKNRMSYYYQLMCVFIKLLAFIYGTYMCDNETWNTSTNVLHYYL